MPDDRPRPRRARRVLRRTAAVVVGLWLALTLAAAVYDVAGGGTVATPALDAHGGTVATGDVVTHFEQWGSSGPPIVLVHGFLESAQAWREAGPLLAARGYRVYAIDVRGFGYTTRKGPYTLAADTDQLLAFLNAQHLDAAHAARAVLVGHSSGAAIIAEAARRNPSAMAGIVLMDGDGTPYGVGPGWVHRLLVDPYATALVRLGVNNPGIAGRVYARACGPTCPPFDAATWLTPFRVAGAEAALKSILSQPLIGLTYDEEREIRVPAAVVYGTQDPQMTASDARATAARLHTGTVLPVAGAGHLGMLSHPAAFTEAILTAVRALHP